MQCLSALGVIFSWHDIDNSASSPSSRYQSGLFKFVVWSFDRAHGDASKPHEHISSKVSLWWSFSTNYHNFWTLETLYPSHSNLLDFHSISSGLLDQETARVRRLLESREQEYRACLSAGQEFHQLAKDYAQVLKDVQARKWALEELRTAKTHTWCRDKTFLLQLQ